ncbi:ABC transporter ATP-binding protein [Cupriavidus sp. H39]|uniref:ABC transporter ATP-binding protein n=1 Tax=Cupriavidus sp. H39 TaxID=3401635 RepID=UPI003D0680CA
MNAMSSLPAGVASRARHPSGATPEAAAAGPACACEPARPPLLAVDGLVKRYGGLTATDGFSITVGPGEIHAVIGPNGAGKTTLIGQLAGELAPDAGTIRFDGRDITRAPAHQRALAGLARSYQVTSVFPEFTALQNVALAVQAHRGHSFRFWQPVLASRELLAPAYAALGQVGLAHRAGTLAAEMAHGEHRQLELAMALATAPRLLLLDEPMAGMSQLESERMVALLQGLRGRLGMVLVEHDMDAVFALADRITVLVYGRPLACGTPDQIRNHPQVKAAYLGDQEQAFQAGSR